MNTLPVVSPMIVSPTRSHEYPNERVSDVIFRTPATSGFTKRDWLDLAMAALDQGGLSKRQYDAVEKLLPVLEDEDEGPETAPALTWR